MFNLKKASHDWVGRLPLSQIVVRLVYRGWSEWIELERDIIVTSFERELHEELLCVKSICQMDRRVKGEQRCTCASNGKFVRSISVKNVPLIVQ